ncbi:unnamed protein product, partial [Ectocarpus sp. 8 AP-2014]
AQGEDLHRYLAWGEPAAYCVPRDIGSPQVVTRTDKCTAQDVHASNVRIFRDCLGRAVRGEREGGSLLHCCRHAYVCLKSQVSRTCCNRLSRAVAPYHHMLH